MLTSTDEIEMWGDGKQTRSFTFIDDCVEGILRITKSDFTEVRPPHPDPALSPKSSRMWVGSGAHHGGDQAICPTSPRN